jgi:hypothetical protein
MVEAVGISPKGVQNMREKRTDARSDMAKERYSRFFIKNHTFKNKVKVLNISKAGILYELPKDSEAMEVGEVSMILFQAGDEISTFAVTIRWVSDYFKTAKQKEFRKYGAQINPATFTNPHLWDDYQKYLVMKKRFSLK